MAKLAVELDRALAERRVNGASGRTTPRPIAGGDGWTVSDVVCTCGPGDRPFEELHTCHSIAMVLSGSFQYRCPAGRGVLVAGSLMLGTEGHAFECAHQHGEGDRCVAFTYSAEYFDRLAADVGLRRSDRRFAVPMLPPLAELSPLIVRVGAAVEAGDGVSWEELALTLAGRTIALSAGVPVGAARLPPNAEARVTRAARTIERHPDGWLSLERLARDAGLSPYHFLRTFKQALGVTPHQFVLRARLREAALRLAAGSGSVLDIALDSGFGDVSNFNRAFRSEFGTTPRAFRRASMPDGGRLR